MIIITEIKDSMSVTHTYQQSVYVTWNLGTFSALYWNRYFLRKTKQNKKMKKMVMDSSILGGKLLLIFVVVDEKLHVNVL